LLSFRDATEVDRSSQLGHLDLIVNVFGGVTQQIEHQTRSMALLRAA
jgi:hypothetical protein